MRNYDLILRIPHSPRVHAIVEEAADRMPEVTSITTQGNEVCVAVQMSGYDQDMAYRLAWKELAIKLAQRKDKDDEDDEWQELLADHCMQMRAVVEQIVELWPDIEPAVAADLDAATINSFRALCVRANEVLGSIPEESEVR